MTNKPDRILLVEDNPGDARLLSEALREFDDALPLEITHVTRLDEGIESLKREPFDVVLLDLSLPDGQGIETVVRVQDQAPAVPILVLTGLDNDETAVAAVRAGAQDYLVKGQTEGRLLVRAIRYATERKRAQEEIQARYREQAALNAIATATSRSLEIEEILIIALDKVLEITGREMGHIRLRNPATGEITLAAHRGISPQHIDALLHRRTPGGKSDRVFASGEVLVINDAGTEALKDTTRSEGARSLIWIPLRAKEGVVGILNVATARPVPFSSNEVELLKAIGNVIGVALENARLFTEIQHNLNRITALREISVATTSTLNLSTVLSLLLEKIAALLPHSALGISLLNKEHGELRPTACWNLDEEEWKGAFGRSSGSGVSALVFERKSPLAVRHIQSDPRTAKPEFFRKHGLVSYLGLPLIAKGEAMGVLSVYTKLEHHFADDEISFLSTLASQAAMTIHNSQVYEEMSKLASDLARANHVKEEFLGVISHELRTPLNVAKGYVEMLQSGFFGELNPDQVAALKKIANQTNDQLAMINSILHATTIESEVAGVRLENVSLCDFLDELRAAYPPPLDKRLTFQWRYALDLPKVKTDKTKLQYILQNLINNSVKFTPEGEVSVSARVVAPERPRAERLESDNGQMWLTLEVADTGIGISEEFLPVIFEKFSQVDSSSSRVHGGIGLGLHIVKRCTELLKGTIKVESQPGKGSTFTVSIPCGI